MSQLNFRETDSPPIRVMVVEDENIVALELEHLLARLGHRLVASFNSGDAAVAGVPEARPDVILMDIRLRGAMDGIAAAEQIRQIYGTPIIYITAYSDAKTLARVKSSEPYGYILKPINIRELEAVLQIAVYKKHMEMRLRAREAQYYHLFERSNDAILIFDLESLTIQNGNTTALRLFGETAETLGQRTIEDFIAMPHRQTFNQALGQVTADAGQRIELTLRRPDGNGEIEVEASLSLMDEEAGWVQAVLRDVSERNRMQRALKEGEKLAAQGRMAARIAHEINNPLGGIKNSFLLIKDAVPVDHPYHGYVARIESEIDRIARIVRQMGNHYRPASGQATWVDLAEVIRDVLSMVAVSSQHAGVAFVWDPPESPVRLLCVHDDLVQVLYNLIQNAVEASETGKTVELRLHADGQKTVIEVSDQGGGVAEEARERLFEPFFTTKVGDGQHGLGLGLSVSKSLVEAMSGTLNFETSSQGTTFRVQWTHQEEKRGE